MEGAVTALLCRTSDRIATTAEGARALAEALGERMRVQPRLVGTPGEPGETNYDDDLRDARGCLLEAGGQVEDALADGRFPVLTSSDCSICITTLPAVARLRPEALVLWLDAHPDFNDPETTPSGFLGGMCLAAACGAWDAGFDDGHLDPARVVMCGIRDVDAGERVLVETHGVGLVERPSRLAELLAEREVFVHLDLDVLDPRRHARAALAGRGRLQRRRPAHAAGRGGRGGRHHRRRGHRPPGAGAGAPRGHDRRAAAAVTDVVALVGRTSDRAHGRAAGAQALAQALSADARVVGEPARAARGALRRGPARRARDARGGRRHRRGHAAAAADRHRLLDLRRHRARPSRAAGPTHGCCGSTRTATSTRPTRRPAASSGGMCLAGAVGLWDTGYGAGPGPERVVLVGGRDLDAAEEELMARHGVVRTDDPAAALAGREVFVHLDVDILDPTVMPGQLYPAPGGLDTTQLRDLLADVAARARIVGAEITCFSTPELSDALAQAAAPLLESPAP